MQNNPYPQNRIFPNLNNNNRSPNPPLPSLPVSQHQWERIESQINNVHPPPPERTGSSFISGDHLILLSGTDIFTFHLKELYWSKLNYADVENPKHSQYFSIRACLLEPGLIMNFTVTLPHLEDGLSLLTFETEDAPKNFRLKTHKLDYSLRGTTSTIPTADRDSAYIFAMKRVDGLNYMPMLAAQFDALSVINLVTHEKSERKIEGDKPSTRGEYQQILRNGKLFIYGGKDEYGNTLADLWVLDLNEMEWKKIKDPLINFSTMVAWDSQLLFCSIQNDTSVIWSYDTENDSWAEHPFLARFPSQLQLQAVHSVKLLEYEDSLLLLNQGNIFSIKVGTREKTKGDKKKKKKVEAAKLQDFMTNLFNEKAFADVIFKVEDQEFPANKCVLCLRCSYFKNMFSSNMMESHNNVITINNVRAKVFQAFLQHIYFSDVELDGDVAEELFFLAHEYMLKDLQEMCEEDLIRNITVENVIKKTLFAEMYEAKELRKACLRFIVKNAEAVYTTQDIKSLGGPILLELQKMRWS